MVIKGYLFVFLADIDGEYDSANQELGTPVWRQKN